jgi:cysteine desulfurase / selenocysteine lyase
MRFHFPIFKNHPDLVYLDSASTTQKPQCTIDAEMNFYLNQNANIHRGIYDLTVTATSEYENTREKIRQFIGAKSVKEVIFTSGTTEGINIVAQCFALSNVEEGDNIIISAMEHHANLIPWQQVCLAKKAELRIIPMNVEGVLEIDALNTFLDGRTKIVAVIHISNTLGTINPIKEIINKAHQQNVPVLIDAAQSISSHDLNVQSLDIDFLVFSAHKLFGPTGIGILYGKENYLNAMKPFKFGGDMIRDVSFEKTTFAPLPNKFEAGTPNIAGVIGLGAAVDFVEEVSRENIRKHINDLLMYAEESLVTIDNLEIIGKSSQKNGILSFILRGIHPHDVSSILSSQNIAIRSGHHCTQPIMDFYEIPGTNRISFSIYNTYEDIDRLINALRLVNKTMRIEEN